MVQTCRLRHIPQHEDVNPLTKRVQKIRGATCVDYVLPLEPTGLRLQYSPSYSSVVLFSRPAQAEWYIAGQAGSPFSGSFDHLGGTSGTIEGLRFPQHLGLQTSPLYGGKIGYYFDGEGWQWVGFEMEAYTSTPHMKQQGIAFFEQGAAPPTPSFGQETSGKNVRVTTWSPMSIMLPIPIGALEPYLGVGHGIYFLHIHDAATDTTVSSNANMGLIGKGRVRWRMTKHLALFAE